MFKDFKPQTIDGPLLEDLQQIVRMAIREDLDRSVDLTTAALVPQGGRGKAAIVARVGGVAAGFNLLEHIVRQFDAELQFEMMVGDSQKFLPRTTLATLEGSVRDLLTCERTILNVLGKLCGIATWTDRFVARVQHTAARVYDTRKTTPGWRRLEKYAVRCGGGHTHRMGLYDAILIKDNHLAANSTHDGKPLDTFTAIEMAREFVHSAGLPHADQIMIEIEIDDKSQLEQALRGNPNIILLDNMSCSEMQRCVLMRDELNPSVELEASGGVNLDTIGAIAETGVDRISVGALTHSAVNLDLGLDWIVR